MKKIVWIVFYCFILTAMLFSFYYTLLSAITFLKILGAREQEWWQYMVVVMSHLFGILVQTTMTVFAIGGLLGKNRQLEDKARFEAGPIRRDRP